MVSAKAVSIQKTGFQSKHASPAVSVMEEITQLIAGNKNNRVITNVQYMLCGCNATSFPSSILTYISYPTAVKLFKNVKFT